jgi:hypothetical protein
MTMPPETAVMARERPIALLAAERPESTMSPVTVDETAPRRLSPWPTAAALPVRATVPVAFKDPVAEVTMPWPAVPVPMMVRLRSSAPLPAVTAAPRETPPSPRPIRLILPADELIVLSEPMP